MTENIESSSDEPTEKKKRKGLLFGIPLTFLAGSGLAFFANVLSIQETVCSVNMGQPGISDTCGAMGAGGKPTRAERLAWADIDRTSCDALRTHIQTFPTGVYRDDAADFLATSKTSQSISWTPVERRLSLFLDQSENRLASRTLAENDARTRGKAKAAQLCRSFAATASYRLGSANVEPQEWLCDSSGAGVTCGMQGDAICALELQQVSEVETCGLANGS